MMIRNNSSNNLSSSSSINNRKRILIEEFLSSSDDRIKEFQLDDHAIEAIFDLLEHPERDIELFKSVTKRLYEIYRSQDRQLRLMTLIFLPTLIAVYIRYHRRSSSLPGSRHQQKLEPNSSIAVLLMCIYNFEIIHQKTGDLKTIDVRLISLAKPSIYHEPNSHTSGQSSVTIPTEQVLAKINNPHESRITIFGPYHEVEQLNTGNQQSVFTVLMKLYNQHIQEAGYYSWQSMCRLYLELLRQGTTTQQRGNDLKQRIKSIIQQNDANQNSSTTNTIPMMIIADTIQVPFTSEFLTELMKSTYFCFYNDLEDLALDLIEEISKRATYKFYADVILMVNAFKNTQAIINRDREDHRAKMKRTNQSEISLNTTPPVTSMTSSRKAAITNASFKTRKLPDDIPIVIAPTPVVTTGTAQVCIQPSHLKKHYLQQQQRSSSLQHNKQNGCRPSSNSFKSLDSINEESSSSPGGQSIGKSLNQNNQKILNNNHAAATTTKPSRKGMIHMFMKDSGKPKKSKSTMDQTANGKIISTHYYNIANNTTEEIIPMKYLKNSKKFIDDDGEIVDNGDSSINKALNPPLAPLEHFTDDEEEYENEGDRRKDSGERIKLRIEISDVSSSDVQSDRSSETSAVALLLNTNNNNNSPNSSQSTSNKEVIKS